MPGLLPTFDKGPLTYSAEVNVLGGSLVEPFTGGTAAQNARIRPASALSETCLGVALGDAAASTYAPADSTDPWGNSIANMNPFPPNETAVAFQGVFKLKVAAATATVPFGALVKCAAAGEVQLHSQGAAATFPMIIGRCVEPGGIVAGARGKIALNVAGA